MVVQHNLSAMNSNRMLGITQGTLSKSTEKLSSGYKINRAADDAAGLAISEKMRKQVRGLTQASANAEDGISAVQTAEGALAEVHDMLQRMNELAVQSANGTQSETDRAFIQDEVDQLSQEIDRVAETTKFNEIYLLKGDVSKEKAAMDYTYSYAKADDVAATAKFATTSSTGLKVDTVTFVNPPTKLVDADNQNMLAKALRDQGLTITTSTVNNQVTYGLELNGSDAKSNFSVVSTTTEGQFEIYNTNHQKVADVTVSGKSTAGMTQVVAAHTVSAAEYSGDVYSLYDKDGNAISANNLSKYFTATGGTTEGAAGTITANSGAPKVYDALGKEVAASAKVGKVSAIKDVRAALNVSFHVGADGTANNKISIKIDSLTAKGLGVNGLRINGTDGSKATDAIETIAAAIKKVSTQRSALGAVQNRLEHTIKNLDNIVENTQSAESAIRDTDMATEMVKYSNSNILQQAGQSMLAQANQSNQGVLSLLG